jgi:hypothetical protein
MLEDKDSRVSEMDPEMVRTHFGVLARFAPSLAAEPVVARHFLERTMGTEVLDPAMIKMLAETQRRIDEMHEARAPLTQHLDRGLNLAQKAMNPHGGGAKPV